MAQRAPVIGAVRAWSAAGPRRRTGIANLKVEFQPGTWLLHPDRLGRQRRQGELPDDYRRRQTLKNAERFITPELKAFEDKALSAQERALAREKLLYEGVLDALAAGIRASRAQVAVDAAKKDSLQADLAAGDVW